MRHIFIVIFLFYSLSSFGQKKDSIEVKLSREIELTQEDSLKITLTYKLASKVSKYDFKKGYNIFKDVLHIVENSQKNTPYFLNYKARIYNRLGSLESRLGNNDKSLDYLLRSANIYIELDNTSKLSTLYHNLGVRYMRTKGYDTSIEYFIKAIDIRKNLKDKSKVAKTYNMIGVTYFYLKQYDSARANYLRAKKIYSKPESKVRVNMNLATLYYVLGEKQKAIYSFEENLLILKKIKDEFNTIIALRNLAKSYSDIGNQKRALSYINEALDLATTTSNKSAFPEIYLQKSVIEEKLKDFSNSLKDHQLYKIYSDSIYNIEKEKEIANIEQQHKLDKEKIVLSNEKEALMIETENQRRKKILYIILFILSVIGIILLIISLFNRKKLTKERIKKEELEKKLLDEKLKSATYQTKKVVADNKMRIQFKKELVNKLKHLKTNNDNSGFQSLINDLQLQIVTESKFDYLGENIEEFDKNFYTNLIEKHPSLTKSEREICALMRINLSLKEITVIRNISISSIKSFRYRIRKKMNIPKEIELEDFIQKLFLEGSIE